ncbi:MAG: peptide deformylase [Acidimicrobiaceae bacterium]|nr:peptide deformylase [Acidimicrobiaceae bacterium]
MPSYQLRLWGDPVLTQAATEVADIDGRIAGLVERMTDTMYEANGLGLAAPQVGVGKRLFIYELEDEVLRTVINPTVVETRGEAEFEEGCLSIPGLYFPIVRPKEIHITGWDLDGSEVSIEADDIEARCLQHELDHLDGVLLLQRLDASQRKDALRELRRRAEGVTP